MMRRVVWLVLPILAFVSVVARAEKRGVDAGVYGGYVWSRGYDVVFGGRVGNLATKAGAMWGIAVDVDLKRALTQLEFLYNRQDTKLNFDFAGEENFITDVSVEYFHVGSVVGVQRGSTYPFTVFTVGATRYATKDAEAADEWRFSFTIGLGVKYYPWERVGFRAQARVPYTFIGNESDFICTENGCFKGSGGLGVWQFDLTAGVFVRL